MDDGAKNGLARFCEKCGYQLRKGTEQYCPKCGSIIPGDESEAASSTSIANVDTVYKSERTAIDWKAFWTKCGDILGILLWAGFAIVFLVTLITGVDEKVNESAIARSRATPPSMPQLDSSLGGYLTINGLKEKTSGGPCRGKALILDTSNGRVHALQKELPDSLRAEKPEDVETVIWIEQERVFAFNLFEMKDVFTKDPGGRIIPAYQEVWHVRIISLKDKEVRYRADIKGGEPPKQIGLYSQSDNSSVGEYLHDSQEYTNGVVGTAPWDETIHWIKDEGKWRK